MLGYQVQQGHSLRREAPPEPAGARVEAPVASVGYKSAKRSWFGWEVSLMMLVALPRQYLR